MRRGRDFGEGDHASWGKDSYVLTFSVLRHSVRRKALKALSNSPLAYSDLAVRLSLSSGHLNYHLRKLAGLIAKGADGKYCLTSLGIEAVKILYAMEGSAEFLEPVGDPMVIARRANSSVRKVFLAISLVLTATAAYLLSLGVVTRRIGYLSQEVGPMVVPRTFETVSNYHRQIEPLIRYTMFYDYSYVIAGIFLLLAPVVFLLLTRPGFVPRVSFSHRH